MQGCKIIARDNVWKTGIVARESPPIASIELLGLYILDPSPKNDAREREGGTHRQTGTERPASLNSPRNLLKDMLTRSLSHGYLQLSQPLPPLPLSYLSRPAERPIRSQSRWVHSRKQVPIMRLRLKRLATSGGPATAKKKRIKNIPLPCPRGKHWSSFASQTA